ncbi:TetR/AcrR family transcriptional regulator [Saccharothrix obliqua]|uniref:TetR/AcrR family transcriptional regulator n=1 Tax=Saccharothrix obliqua TaxID=2861747 RepID=UPI001C6003A6|nr:TetR/AcrR family transcriptional regulator [Saccharothrix obliqua]MBW4717930.1 TetR/AcrR family transcriptional regulator [Saccharothrix obliqua]
MTDRRYHHGDLRRALLTAAVEAIGESGPGGLGLRDLARRVGVSHAAPVHHFRDKAGLLTALAAEGFELLARSLAETRDRGGDFIDQGVAYVEFAVSHKAHFEVMFRPDLHHADDPDLTAARERAGALLADGVTDEEDPRVAAVAAWSLVHGFATLWNTGALSREHDEDPAAVGRRVAAFLFRRS